MSLLISTDISFKQYKIIQTVNEIWCHCYWLLQIAKGNYRLRDNIVRESIAAVKLYYLLDHTTERLCKNTKNLIFTPRNKSHSFLEIVLKCCKRERPPEWYVTTSNKIHSYQHLENPLTMSHTLFKLFWCLFDYYAT